MYSSEVMLSVVSCSVDSSTEVAWETKAEVDRFNVFPQVTSLARLLSAPTTLPQRWPTPDRELIHLPVDLHVCRRVFNRMRKIFNETEPPKYTGFLLIISLFQLQRNTCFGRFVNFKSPPAVKNFSTIVAVVREAAEEMPAFNVVPHIRPASVGEDLADGADVLPALIIFGEELVQVGRLPDLGKVATCAATKFMRPHLAVPFSFQPTHCTTVYFNSLTFVYEQS